MYCLTFALYKVGSLNHGVPETGRSDAVESLLGLVASHTVSHAPKRTRDDTTALGDGEATDERKSGAGGGCGGGHAAAKGAAVVPLRWAADVPMGGGGGGDSGGGGGSGGEGALPTALRFLVRPEFLAAMPVGAGSSPGPAVQAAWVDPWARSPSAPTSQPLPPPQQGAGRGSGEGLRGEGEHKAGDAAGPCSCPFGEASAPWFAQVAATLAGARDHVSLPQ
jgi:hypothetical protein